MIPRGPGADMFLNPLMTSSMSFLRIGLVRRVYISGGHFLEVSVSSGPRNSSMVMVPAIGSGLAMAANFLVMWWTIS